MYNNLKVLSSQLIFISSIATNLFHHKSRKGLNELKFTSFLFTWHLSNFLYTQINHEGGDHGWALCVELHLRAARPYAGGLRSNMEFLWCFDEDNLDPSPSQNLAAKYRAALNHLLQCQQQQIDLHLKKKIKLD